MGAYFEGTFLKKEVISSETYYIGHHSEGEICIVVTGLKNEGNSVNVRYSLPSGINKEYMKYLY